MISKYFCKINYNKLLKITLFSKYDFFPHYYYDLFLKSIFLSYLQCKTRLFYKEVNSVCPRPVFVSVPLPSLLSQVESVRFPQQQNKPVDLWGQDPQVTHVAVQRQVEGHSVQGNPELPAVHPVHEGEHQDPTREEAQEDDDAIDSMQPGVIEAQLDIRGILQLFSPVTNAYNTYFNLSHIFNGNWDAATLYNDI